MFKKGDVIKYVNDGSYSFITLGKTYLVKEDQIGSCVDINDDDGDDATYRADVFKLEAPAIDFTKPLETVEGVPFTLLSTDARGEFPIIGYINANTRPCYFSLDGTYHGAHGDTSSPRYNLRNVQPKPAEAEVFINVYKRDDGTLRCTYVHESVAVADRNAAPSRVARMKVRIVEGRFDE